MAIRTVDYGKASLDAFQVTKLSDKGNVLAMSVNDVNVVPTERFWTSLCSQFSSYGLSMKLFKLYSHQEVFERLRDKLGAGRETLRYAVEHDPAGSLNLLAVSNPAKPLVKIETAESVVAKYNAAETNYTKGTIVSTHTPAHMDDFVIGPDKFSYRYVMETPIDGFGCPLIYLSLLRHVCTNGAIGYARAFRSEVSLGKANDDPAFTLERALDSFSNEEGYSALRMRFESAANSWASIADTDKIYKALQKVAGAGLFNKAVSGNSPLVDYLNVRRSAALNLPEAEAAKIPESGLIAMRAFRQLTGDLASIYDLTTLDALSAKRQRQLAAKCTMYELFNFITEVATHYCAPVGSNILQAELGNLLSTEYDLEGTKEAKPTFQDWLIDTSDLAGDADLN
jgi:hypothetical protein